MTKSQTMSQVLNLIAESGSEEVQVRLAHDFSPNPLGPGKIARVPEVDGAFRILTPADIVVSGAIGKRQERVIMPILFVADDVLWISERPIRPESASLVQGS